MSSIRHLVAFAVLLALIGCQSYKARVDGPAEVVIDGTPFNPGMILKLGEGGGYVRGWFEGDEWWASDDPVPVPDTEDPPDQPAAREDPTDVVEPPS